jgi:predicted nucleic acid-binding protein
VPVDPHSSSQFWDTSAIVSLIYKEPHTTEALRAHANAFRSFAWGWLEIEAQAALLRRGATAADLKTLQNLLSFFDFIDIDPDPKLNHYPSIRKILEVHRLRAADAGHLFCLLQAKKIQPDIIFVCFDEELIRAAQKEGVRVFGLP